MLGRLRGQQAKAECGDHFTAALFLSGGDVGRLRVALDFVGRRMAASRSLPPAQVLLGVVENGLGAESDNVRIQCYRLLLFVYRHLGEVVHWDQVRRVVKRELIEGDGPAFLASLNLLSSLPASYLTTFVCSKDGSSCIRSVSRNKDASLRAAAIPVLARVLLSAWRYFEQTDEGAEGLQSHWVSPESPDSELELTSDEPHRVREDLAQLLSTFFSDAAWGCLSAAPSGDPSGSPLPDSVAACAAYFEACNALLLAAEGGGADLASLAPFVVAVLELFFEGSDTWALACSRAIALVNLPLSLPQAHPQYQQQQNGHHHALALSGVSALSRALLLMTRHADPPPPSSSSSALFIVAGRGDAAGAGAGAVNLQTALQEWCRLALLPLLSATSRHPQAASQLLVSRLLLALTNSIVYPAYMKISSGPSSACQVVLGSLARCLQQQAHLLAWNPGGGGCCPSSRGCRVGCV